MKILKIILTKSILLFFLVLVSCYKSKNDKTFTLPKDLYEFTTPMLISSENIKNDINNTFYDINNKYLMGVITEVNLMDNFFKISILKSTNEFNESFRNIENEVWKINIETFRFGENNEMCLACESDFKTLIVPERRLKFAMVEGFPGAGTAFNGVWYLTYAKEIDIN